MDKFFPGLGGVHVHLDDAGVGGDFDDADAGVEGGRGAFEDDGHVERGGGVFDGAGEVEEVLDVFDGRKEEVDAAVAGFGAKGGAGDPTGGLAVSGDFGVCWGVFGSVSGFTLAAEAGGEAGALGVEGSGFVGFEPIGDGLDVLLAAFGFGGKRGASLLGVRLVDPGEVGFGDPGEGIEGEAVAHGGVTGDEVHAFVAKEPGAGLPDEFAADPVALEGEGVADDVVEALGEDFGEAFAFEGVFQVGLEGIDVGGEAAFFPEVVEGVFVAGLEVGGVDFEGFGEGEGEALGIGGGVAVVDVFVGDEVEV